MVLPISNTELSEIDKYHKKAKALGYDFRLITIAKPKKSTIEIAWLEKALLKYFAVHPIGSTQYQDIEAAIRSSPALKYTKPRATTRDCPDYPLLGTKICNTP